MTYIIDAIRTPIGNFGGTLKDVRTDDLGAERFLALDLLGLGRIVSNFSISSGE